MRLRIALLTAIVAFGLVSLSYGGLIVNVVETGGDNELTDTITAKWTGQTWATTIGDEPVKGLAVGTSFTLGTFGGTAPLFVDRNHRVLDDTTNAVPVPNYLVGKEYIMSGNDNRDNAQYRLDVTLSAGARVYMLIDNRLGKPDPADNTTPPVFDATHMQWILDQGWMPNATGSNRKKSAAFPDEVPIDEGADNTINQYYSVYYKDFQGGTFSLFQADNGGRDMYSAVVPEPASLALLAFGVLGLAIRRRA